MPELPDLKVYAKNLKPKILNKKIEDVTVYNPKKINVDPKLFKESIIGSSISDILAEGKELFFYTSNKNVFSAHLMLKGECYCEAINEYEKIKYKIISIIFSDKTTFTIRDQQSFCRISFNPEQSEVPGALSDDFNFDYFYQKAQDSKRKNIKAFLLDQNVVRGIGNAYADEILWKANISPRSIVGKIPFDILKLLFSTISEVLMWGATQIIIISPDIIRGEERSFFNVHNPKLSHTKTGDKIVVEKIASKTTYFTESQIEYN